MFFKIHFQTTKKKKTSVVPQKNANIKAVNASLIAALLHSKIWLSVQMILRDLRNIYYLFINLLLCRSYVTPTITFLCGSNDLFWIFYGVYMSANRIIYHNSTYNCWYKNLPPSPFPLSVTPISGTNSAHQVVFLFFYNLNT